MQAEGGMRLRPMGIGDIVDESIKIYRRDFLTFVSAMAISGVLSAIYSIAINLATPTMTGRTGPSLGQLAALMTIALPGGIIVGLVYLVSSGAVAWIASEAILGRAPTVGEAMRRAASKLLSLVWGGFLIGLAVGLLFITILGIPFAIYLAVGWSLYYQAVVIEGLGGRAAMRRSSSLVAGYRWRTLGIVILMSIITSILVSIPATLIGALFGGAAVMSGALAGSRALTAFEIVNALTSAAAQAIFGSLAIIVMTVLYYELRVRKEGFDLEQRALAGEGPTGPAAAESPGPTGYQQPQAPYSS